MKNAHEIEDGIDEYDAECKIGEIRAILAEISAEIDDPCCEDCGYLDHLLVERKTYSRYLEKLTSSQ